MAILQRASLSKINIYAPHFKLYYYSQNQFSSLKQIRYESSYKPLLVKCVSQIYQQTFIYTSRVAFVKVYDCKNALVAADMLNDKVLPFTEEHQIPLLRILTDRGQSFVAQETITNMNFTWHWRMLITPELSPNIRRQSAFVNGSAAPSRMNSMQLPLERRSMNRYSSSK